MELVSSAASRLSGLVEWGNGSCPGGAPWKSVLLIEGREDVMLSVRYALNQSVSGRYRLEWAHCLSEGLTRLLTGGIDVVLLGHGLPDSSGPRSYAYVREAAHETPVVVLMGDTCEEAEHSLQEHMSGSRLVDAIQHATAVPEVCVS